MSMKTGVTRVFALALGAVAMYLLDPVSGHRRRVLARDRGRKWLRLARRELRMTARHMANRGRGLVAETRHRLRAGAQLDDGVLAAQIRAKLGRWVEHPHSIVVSCEQGEVCLGGMIGRNDRESLIQRIKQMPGVVDVVDRLAEGSNGNGRLAA